MSTQGIIAVLVWWLILLIPAAFGKYKVKRSSGESRTIFFVLLLSAYIYIIFK